MLQIHPSDSWEKAIQGGRACTPRQSACWGTERWTSRLTQDTVCSQSWEMGWWTDMRCGAKRAINEKTDILHLSRRKTGAVFCKNAETAGRASLGGGITSLFFYMLTLRSQLDTNSEKASGQSRYSGGQNKDNASSYVPGWDYIVSCAEQTHLLDCVK